MSRERILHVARQECDSHCLPRRGLVSIDIGAGWILITHTYKQWMVVL